MIGAASSDSKEEAIRGAGADHFINYTKDNLRDKVQSSSWSAFVQARILVHFLSVYNKTP